MRYGLLGATKPELWHLETNWQVRMEVGSSISPSRENDVVGH